MGDKLIVSLIVLTLYLGVGDSTDFEQQINILSCLFMWALLPAFGAMSYVPAIVLGEPPLHPLHCSLPHT